MLRHWLKITQASDYEVLDLASGFRHFLWNSYFVDYYMVFRVVPVQAFRYVVQVLLDYATIRGVDTQCMIAHGPSGMGRVVSYILAQFKALEAS